MPKTLDILLLNGSIFLKIILITRFTFRIIILLLAEYLRCVNIFLYIRFILNEYNRLIFINQIICMSSELN